MNIPDAYKHVLLKVGAGLVILLGFGGGMIYPLISNSAALEVELANAETDLYRQEMFAPVFARLVGQRDHLATSSLVVPEPVAITRSEFMALPETLPLMVEGTGLEVADVSLGDGAVEYGVHVNENESSRVQIVLVGAPEAFHAFYLKFGEAPWVQKVERVEMRAVTGGVEMYVQAQVLVNGGY